MLLLTGILFFFEPLFLSKNFYFRDILSFHYPLRKVLIESYARGEFPLWNPFLYFGQPMAANPNFMAFYPTNLLHLFLPFNYAFKLHFIIHPLLGGLGAYFLQRKLGIPVIAAFGGSFVYQFSGTVLSFLNLYNIVPVVALMPWAAWAFLRALSGSWWSGGILFGAILALQIIACEPFTSQSVLMLLLGMSVFHLLDSVERRTGLRNLFRVLALGGIFGLGFSAVQLLPTLQLMPRSTRGSGHDFAVATEVSMHPADLVNVLVPNLFGNPYTITRSNHWGEVFHSEREPYLVSFYLGAAALLPILASFASQRRRLQMVMVVLALLSLIFALGRFNPFYRWIYDYVPGARLGRFPSKYFLLGSLSLSVLVSLGLEVILTIQIGNRRSRRLLIGIAVFGLVLAFGLLAVWAYGVANPRYVEDWIRNQVLPSTASFKDFPRIRQQLTDSLLASSIFLLLSGSLLWLGLTWKRPALRCGLIMLVICADLIPSNLGLSPLISDADVYAVSDVISFLHSRGPREPYRVAPASLIKPMPDVHLRAPNSSLAWLTFFHRRSGLPMYGIMNGVQYSLELSVDHLNTRESDELWQVCKAMPEESRLALLQKLNSPVVLVLGEIRDPRLRPLASFDTWSEVKLNAYWLENSLPRAYFASGVEPARSHTEALSRLVRPDFPYGNTVILEDMRIQERPGQTGWGRAQVVQYQDQRVLCEVESGVPGFLVLLDSYYPGWRAYLDGKKAETFRANYAFRAVEVPAGKHTVEFLYRPVVFYAGLGATGATLLVGILSILWQNRRKISSRISLRSLRLGG